MKRVIVQRVLPGQPTDGSGSLCVHLLVRDAASRFEEPHVLHRVVGHDGKPVKGQLTAKPTRMRLACDRRRDFRPKVVNWVTHVTHRTEEVSAVNCPKCMATREYRIMVAARQDAKAATAQPDTAAQQQDVDK